MTELDIETSDSIATYRRTAAEEEGRMISFSRALREFRSPRSRGIYEYRGEPKPNNGIHIEAGLRETVIYGTK